MADSVFNFSLPHRSGRRNSAIQKGNYENKLFNIKASEELICSECGNKERFIEVMAVETHLVNRHKDYIKLLDGIADHYLCWKCGARIKDAIVTAVHAAIARQNPVVI